MIVQEPVQAAIWHCLNHYAFQDATFLAERLCSEVETDDTIFLLATCYYRSGQVHQAHWLLSSKKINSPQCRFLLAKCAFELKEYYAAEMALTLDYPLKPTSLDSIALDFGEVACFALQLLARICTKSERQELATQSHKHALKLNPFLWQSFTDLCHLRQTEEPPIDPDQIFQFTTETFRTCQSQTGHLGVRESAVGITLDAGQLSKQQQGQGQNNPPNVSIMYSPSTLTTPLDQIIQPNQQLNLRAIPFDATTPSHNNTNNNNNKSSSGGGHFVTPQENVLGSGQNKQNQVAATGAVTVVAPPMTAKKQFRLMSHFSPMTPSFGVMPLTSPMLLHTPIQQQQQQPQSQQQQQSLANEAPVVVAKKIRSHHHNHPQFNTNNNSIKRKDSPLPESKFLLNQVNNMTNVRRSSRLFSSSNSYSVKENNNKQAEQTNNLLNNNINSKAPKSPMRKSKQRMAGIGKGGGGGGGGGLNSSLGELNEKATTMIKGPLVIEEVTEEMRGNNNINTTNNPSTVTTTTTQSTVVVDAQQMLQHVLNLKRDSVEGLMALLRQLGKACSALDRFNCREALELFRSLPPQHLSSAWVQSQIAVAHHEMHEYEATARIFREVHRQEPHRLQSMEIYSTALWHLQREVELSALAHDLMAQDKNSPVTWCVTGNCFSLHKEHDVAVKFFQRAVQVDAEFVYSYILLGHEFVITEELEKAMSCFRTAINKEFRHYNAWFGIGTIYSKQEKFQQAELYYQRALRINPRNSVLLVHIGAMQLFSKQMDQALVTLNGAIRLDPGNPLGKFHRSRLYFATKRYAEALAELEELKEIVPKESVIYYLIGKIHTKMGNSDLGLMHFSWASDLDPKGANNQIKESFDSAAAMAAAGGSGGNGGGTGAGGDRNEGLADSTVNTNNNSSLLGEGEDGETEGEEEEEEPEEGGATLDGDVTGGGGMEEMVGGEEDLGEDELEDEQLLVVGADDEEMGSRSFRTPTTRSGNGAGTMAAVRLAQAAAAVTPAAQVAATTTSTTGTTAAANTDSSSRFASETSSSGMETPRTWNVLNYDSDSF